MKLTNVQVCNLLLLKVFPLLPQPKCRILEATDDALHACNILGVRVRSPEQHSAHTNTATFGETDKSWGCGEGKQTLLIMGTSHKENGTGQEQHIAV